MLLLVIAATETRQAYRPQAGLNPKAMTLGGGWSGRKATVEREATLTYLVYQRRKAVGYLFETRSLWVARLVGSLPGLNWCATFSGPVMSEEEYLWSEWYA